MWRVKKIGYFVFSAACLALPHILNCPQYSHIVNPLHGGWEPATSNLCQTIMYAFFSLLHHDCVLYVFNILFVHVKAKEVADGKSAVIVRGD